MCGIFVVHKNDPWQKVQKILTPRGPDGQRTSEFQGFVFGHQLHAMVGHVPQPIIRDGILVANCEIYNWRTIAQDYDLEAKNDADLLSQLFDAFGVEEILPKLDGVYAFVYYRDETFYVARDLFGVKPLWFADERFASESKALKILGLKPQEINPRKLYIFGEEHREITRDFFKPSDTIGETVSVLSHIFETAVQKRTSEKKIGVLLSGGVDSTLIATCLQALNIDFTCYTAVHDNPNGEDPHDLTASVEVAKRYGFKHEIIRITDEQLPDITRHVAAQIETTDAVKVAVGIPFYVAAKKASEDGCKVLFSGLGAEELFAGYKRHKDATDINAECIKGMLAMHERDLYRDDVLTMRQGIELRLPFLDKDLVQYSMQLPGEQKIRGDMQKYILREAAQRLGLHEDDAFRPKKAAQYGSKFDRALKRLADKQGMKREEYISWLLKV